MWQFEAQIWQPNTAQLAVLTGHFSDQSKPYTKKAGHDALAALRLAGLAASEVTEHHIKHWHSQHTASAQLAAGSTTPASVRQQHATRDASTGSSLRAGRVSMQLQAQVERESRGLGMYSTPWVGQSS